MNSKLSTGKLEFSVKWPPPMAARRDHSEAAAATTIGNKKRGKVIS